MDNPDVLEYYSDKFKYVLVDEYQDTNKSQFTLVTLLASKYGNITVVGDNDQGIYSFRGADISNILNFEKDFPGTEIIKLEQNYRCTGSILNAANAVIKITTASRGINFTRPRCFFISFAIAIENRHPYGFIISIPF